MQVHAYFLLVALFAYKVNGLAQLEEVFAWKKLSFAWPSEEIRNAAIDSGEYVPENNLPLGLERWKDKLFITIPRWKSGVPTSLGYISLNHVDSHSPAIIPYPTWEANAVPREQEKLENDNKIISTFRVAVDSCDRLWVIDSGFIDVLGKPREISSPAILIYDLNTDQLIRRYVLESKVLKEGHYLEGSFFPNIITDTNKHRCDDAYAYLPDVSSSGLIVYSFKHNKSWRFEHPFFHFDPIQANFYSDGVNFQFTDGIFGIALAPENENGFRTAYFHPTASLNEFSVDTAVLKNETLAHEPLEHIYYLFKLEGCKGENTQTTASVLDLKSNVIFLTQLNREGVACWNPRRPLIPENVPMIAQDHEKLSLTNDIRIDDDRYLWIISNKMFKFVYDHLNNEEINYRIFRVKVDNAIAGTPCVA